MDSGLSRSILALTIAAAAACGRGGAGGGPADAGPADAGPAEDGGAPVGDLDNFFPLDGGDHWRLVVTTQTGGRQTPKVAHRRVAGTKDLQGVTATVLAGEADGGTDDVYLVKDKRGLQVLGTGDTSDAITPQLVPYTLLRFPLQPGEPSIEVDRSGLDSGSDLDGDGRHESVAVRATVQVVALEDLSVPAGAFHGCAHVRTTTQVTLTLSQSGRAATGSAIEDIWYAPGVGPVRRRLSSGTFVVESDALLEGAVVGGVRHGVYGDLLPLPALDPQPDSNTTLQPAIAWNGSEYAVAAPSHLVNGYPSSTSIAFFDARGARLGAVEIPSARSASLAWNGSAWLLGYVSQGSSAQRLDGSGAPIGAAIHLGGDNLQPTVASDGRGWLLVWDAYLGGDSAYDVLGAIVAADGTAAGPFSIAAGPGYQINSRAVFDGKNYLVTWTDEGHNQPGDDVHLFGVRVSPAGAVLDSPPIAIATGPGTRSAPSLASNGAGTLAVWSDAAGGRAVRIGQDGALVGGAAAQGGAPLGLPGADAVAFDGTDYRVTWRRSEYLATDGIYTARVSTDGVVRDPAGVLAAPAPSLMGTPGIVANAALASDGAGGSFLVWLQIASDKSIAGALVAPK